MKKILLVGFSVTADSNGYAELTKKMLQLADPSLKVDILGVGGVNPLPLTALFDLIFIEEMGYTDVVLEIATSIYGLKISSVEDEVIDVLYGILHRLQNAGVRVSFVNFFRDNFDYNYHIFDMIIESICARFDVKLLDLGRKLWVSKGRNFCRTLLRDDVHTSETGANYQALSVASFILDFIADRKYRNFSFPPPRMVRKAVNCSKFSDSISLFSRSGLKCEVANIYELESINIELPIGRMLFGVSYLSGPRSGEIKLDFHDESSIAVQCFDEYCFYKRYNFSRFKPRRSVGQVTITQLAGVPTQSLKKGIKDYSQRLGEIVQLHYY